MSRRVGGTVALAATLVLTLWAVARLWAEVDALLARHEITQWNETGRVQDVEAWQTATEQLAFAARLKPWDAELDADRGIAHEWRARSLPFREPQAQRHRAKTVAYLEQALHDRPTWAYAWALLARTKFLMGEFDEAAHQAFEKASILGPREAPVQRTLAWSGFAYWNALTPEAKDTTRTMARHLLQSGGKDLDFVIDTALAVGWGSRLERLLISDKQHDAFERKRRAYLERWTGER